LLPAKEHPPHWIPIFSAAGLVHGGPPPAAAAQKGEKATS